MNVNSKSSGRNRSLASVPKEHRALMAADQDVSLSFFLGVFAQWWKWLVPVTLVLLAASVALVLFLFRPQYRASAWLQVKSQQPYIAFPDERPNDRESAIKFVYTQIELLRSPLILGRALSQPGVAQLPELRRQRDPVDWLSKRGLKVTPKGDSDLLEVAYEGSDPEAAAQLVDAVVNAYFSVLGEKSDSKVQDLVLLLEGEKSRRAEGIKLLQNEVRTASSSVGRQGSFTGCQHTRYRRYRDQQQSVEGCPGQFGSGAD